jgi:hypothetical protein
MNYEETLIKLRNDLIVEINKAIDKYKEISIDMCPWAVNGEDIGNFYFDNTDVLFDGDSISLTDICADDLLYIVEQIKEIYGDND